MSKNAKKLSSLGLFSVDLPVFMDIECGPVDRFPIPGRLRCKYPRHNEEVWYENRMVIVGNEQRRFDISIDAQGLVREYAREIQGSKGKKKRECRGNLEITLIR